MSGDLGKAIAFIGTNYPMLANKSLVCQFLASFVVSLAISHNDIESFHVDYPINDIEGVSNLAKADFFTVGLDYRMER